MSLDQLLAQNTVQHDHVRVSALAGTGKTATIIDIVLKTLYSEETSFLPSPEQQAICDAICADGYSPNSVLMVAFNKSIQMELEKRAPKEVTCKTMHALGLATLRSQYQLKRGKGMIDKWKVERIIEEILGKDIWELKKKPAFSAQLKVIKALVKHCKAHLVPREKWACEDTLGAFVSHFNIDCDDISKVSGMVNSVLCRTVDGFHQDLYLDFDDMVWLPIVLECDFKKHDLVFVDESQDLNRIQQELCIRSGRRVVYVGDENQAIYGFTGADTDGMNNFGELLEGEVQNFPLNATRRCGKAIVAEAQKIVPSFTYADNVSEGAVDRLDFKDDGDNWYRDQVREGDMVLCRTNAPLVSECLGFLKERRKAKIIGKEFGDQLVRLIKKQDCGNVPDLVIALDSWKEKQLQIEAGRKWSTESRQILIKDQHECLINLSQESLEVSDLIESIKYLFTDTEDERTIRLSSIHKSKGLEADNVFFLMPPHAPCPHPMAKKDWQKKQEMNLKYVAITRAKHRLVYVK